jgi:hypothetical protein
MELRAGCAGGRPQTNPNDEGLGGDAAADALRHLLATRRRTLAQRKLRGL